MSHLSFPRVHFRGDFVANVYTANNDAIATPSATVQYIDSANVQIDTLGMTDAQFRQWLREVEPDFGIRGGWNLFGDGKTTFDQVQVHSVQPGNGIVHTTPAGDSLISATVDLFDAVMVDLDPEGTLGTQIFCNEFDVFGPSGVSIVGSPGQFFSRWVLKRNLSAGSFTAYAAVWHAVVHPDRLTIVPGDSTIAGQLRAAHDAGNGLFIRFCTYLVAPQLSEAQLAAEFALGQNTQNPAIGKLLGTIGVWSPHEMRTLPVGRRLARASMVLGDHAPFFLNPAVVQIDPQLRIISCDLINTVPERDTSLAKVNLGELALYVESTSSGATHVDRIGAIAYDRTAYETFGGTSDVTFPVRLDEAIATGRLRLVRESSHSVLLQETAPTIETDDRCIYLQQGEQRTVTLQAHQQGLVPPATIVIGLTQFILVSNSLIPSSKETAVVDHPASVTSGADGSAQLNLTALRPGNCLVAFGTLSGPGIPDYFMCIRVLPTDNYDHIPDEQLTFQLIYKEVLRYYYLLYPNMNDVIDLHDEMAVGLHAAFIRERIAAADFNLYSYMPRTRELSNGKRRLLERWCARVIGQ